MQPYWLSRPGPAPDAATRAEFDALLAAALADGPGAEIDYRLAAPKWQFLCYVADRGEAVLHGSSDPAIARFEPRQSNDIAEFGNRTAVYAAAGAGIGAGSMPDRSWPGRALVHTVRS